MALTDEDLAEGVSFDEGTLGDLLRSLVQRLFPDRRLERLRGEWSTAPGELEAELQARLKFMEHP